MADVAVFLASDMAGFINGGDNQRKWRKLHELKDRLMVIDKTENILFYTSMVPALRAGNGGSQAIQKPEPGKYKFDGGFLQCTDRRYETHGRGYI